MKIGRSWLARKKRIGERLDAALVGRCRQRTLAKPSTTPGSDGGSSPISLITDTAEFGNRPSNDSTSQDAFGSGDYSVPLDGLQLQPSEGGISDVFLLHSGVDDYIVTHVYAMPLDIQPELQNLFASGITDAFPEKGHLRSAPEQPPLEVRFTARDLLFGILRSGLEQL